MSNADDHSIDLAKVRAWVREAGEIALARRWQHESKLKGDGTPVTGADEEIEAVLVERIRERHPGHPILGEESGSHRGGQGAGAPQWLWAIDPLDGTRAYAGGLPVWGVSVGILRRGRPWAGFFYLPAQNELYWTDGCETHLNEDPLPLAVDGDMDDPLGYLAVPSNAHKLYEVDLPRLRSLGSTAAHLLWVITSSSLGVITRRVYLWDLAGVLPILECHGAQLRYLSGAAFDAEELISGRRLPEPLLVTKAGRWAEVRGRIAMRRD